MKYIKENWKFFIFVVLICIVGGYFTTIYLFQTLDQNVFDDAIKQIGSKELLIVVSVAQISLYALIFSTVGIILSNKIGLWKKFEKDNVAIVKVIIVSIVGGLLLSVFDKYVFGSFIDQIFHSYDTKPTFMYIISSFTYGGVFEEVLMRLFLMSLIVWIISKVFYRKEGTTPICVFVIANIMSALLFALGHVPATIQIFGYINSLLLVRCFLLNGGLGLAFGSLYRKHGIVYAMLAHFGVHFISKLIWLLFL